MVKHRQKHLHIGEEEPQKEEGNKERVGETIMGHHYHSLDSIEKKGEMERKIFSRWKKVKEGEEV